MFIIRINHTVYWYIILRMSIIVLQGKCSFNAHTTLLFLYIKNISITITIFQYMCCKRITYLVQVVNINLPVLAAKLIIILPAFLRVVNIIIFRLTFRHCFFHTGSSYFLYSSGTSVGLHIPLLNST